MDGWFEELLNVLEKVTEWEIYRGDEFQLEIKNQKTRCRCFANKSLF
jgi:hypothetical protein